MRTVAIVSAAFAAIFAYSEACTCWSQHPQTHFCNSDFVIRAAILNRKTVNMEIVYTVRILKEFKNGAGRGYSQKQDIYTNPSSASCGSYFELRKEYIISAFSLHFLCKKKKKKKKKKGNHIMLMTEQKTKTSFWNNILLLCHFVVFLGSINRGKWVTYLCEFNAVPSSLTQYQRAALDLGIYENSCSCKASYF
ncbi:uncharacterized protein LOC125654610 [Ostrea edulis]|uniref:uncharacterized protein LOC125654610 n=1 Tax=Ostrea edulis TaxID=37623 RepID=UPI0024AF0BA8|nr:uncharacterized protein LOC125654610 [Ostrea edulis]